jgi:hypothetical protein
VITYAEMALSYVSMTTMLQPLRKKRLATFYVSQQAVACTGICNAFATRDLFSSVIGRHVLL